MQSQPTSESNQECHNLQEQLNHKGDENQRNGNIVVSIP